MLFIRQIQVPIDGFEVLQKESVAEGHQFLERMEEDWTALYGAFDHEGLIAVGGLTPDPYVSEPNVGRLRRIYVKQSHRKRGIGTALVMQLLGDASRTFQLVRLRAANSEAARLYERLGFRLVQ
jgi:GNAT superfamily N-acetyltransferase